MKNFDFVHGDVQPAQFQATDRVTGAAVNLTGCKLYFTMKYDSEADLDVAAVCQKTSPSGGIVIDDAANGLFTVTLQPADTSSLANRKTVFVYDIQLRDSGNLPYTLARGFATMLPEVTITTS